MASVLGIVSKAIFEKMVSKTVKVGDVVATDRYSSAPAAFEQLESGDAIFLVTVRPPDETLWLVAILEKPKKQGGRAWVGSKNVAPIRDITSLIKRLQFGTGKGITAKPGALAMSLQTPRVLTAQDVSLLRGDSSGVGEYRRQVAATPAAKQAKASASAVTSGRFTIANIRKPFDDLSTLAKVSYEQLAQLTENEDAGTPEDCVADEVWAPMELADVIDTKKGGPAFQLYVWPYGSGALFGNNRKELVATIIQHSFDMTADDDDLQLRRDLAAAYAANPLSETIDFQLDKVKPKKSDAEKTERATQRAAIERIQKALGDSKERYRLFEKLTKVQQAAIQEEYPRLDPYESYDRFERVGIPPRGALARWAGIESPGSLERAAGKWPVWKWMKAAIEHEVEASAAIQAITKALDANEVADLASTLCARSAKENDYEFWPRGKNSQREINEGTAATTRLLGALIDASAENAAVDFAKRTQKHLAKEPEFGLGAVAMFALAARAARRKETLPKTYFPLADQLEFMGCGRCLGIAVRELFELVRPEDREQFFDAYGMYFLAQEEEEIRNGRTIEVPTLLRGWLVADLVPTKKVAKKMIEDVATWNHYPKPKKEALEVIEKVGAVCVPFLDKAVKTSKSPHKKVLEQALDLFREPPKKSARKR